MEKKHRQKLSMEFIKYDIKKDFISNIPENIFYLIVSVVCGLFAYTTRYFTNDIIDIKILFYVFSVLTGMVSILIFILVLCSIIRGLRTIKSFQKGKFSVVTDKLIASKEMKHIGWGGFFSKPYCLQFENYPSYEISRGKYYKWSSKYSMNEASLFNSSQAGDVFYLVKVCDNSPTAVYNTKYFYIE